MPSREIKRRIDLGENPLVSIITPLFNAQNYIEECIRSVQAQTFDSWELLIIDDASHDSSLKIVRRLAQNDPRIKVTALDKNKGAAFCRNLATEQACGAFIAFLDADDIWFPDKLSTQLITMEREQAAVCFSSYKKIDRSGNDLRTVVRALPYLTYKKQRLNNYIGNLTGIYHAAGLGKIIAPNIRKRQDWAVWLEAIKRSGQPAVGIYEPLAAYRILKTSMSANKIGLLKYNYTFYRTHLGYSTIRSVYMMTRFLIEYFFVRPGLIRKSG